MTREVREQMRERGKRRATGSTMRGTGAIVGTVALALGGTLWGCARDGGPTGEPRPPSEAPASAEREPSDAPASAERAQAAQGSGEAAGGAGAADRLDADSATQADVARALVLAIEGTDARRSEDALTVLASKLGTWRGGAPDPTLHEAIRKFGAADARSLRRRVDPRYLPSLLELLVDAADWAAIDRIVGGYGDTPVAALIARYGTAARAIPEDAAVEVARPSDPCAVEVNGTAIGDAPARVALRPGSHRIACRGPERVSVLDLVVRPGETVGWTPGEQVVGR